MRYGTELAPDVCKHDFMMKDIWRVHLRSFISKEKLHMQRFAPERGRSALDAVELMSVGANYLREHVVDKARIHYTTDSGGFSPNIVPDKASAWYFTRAPHISDVKTFSAD